MESGMTEMMAVADLAFDIRNPRLVEFGLGSSASDSEVAQVLWDEMDVREVLLSIAASGYFHHEPLIVAREDGKNVVIEGNRRLAAVKVLLRPKLVEATGIPIIRKEAKRALRRLPTIVSTPRSLVAVHRFQARERSGQVEQLRQVAVYREGTQGVRR